VIQKGKVAPKILHKIDPSQPIKYHEKAIVDDAPKVLESLELTKTKEGKKKLKRNDSFEPLVPIVNDLPLATLRNLNTQAKKSSI